MAKPEAISDQTFEQEVLKSDIPVLVDFWAVWCQPCLMVAPVLEEIAEEYEGKLKVCKMDVDNNRQVAAQIGISSIPTLLLFKDGKLVESMVGALPKQLITPNIDKHLG